VTLTSALFRAARLTADQRAFACSIATGSLAPLFRRLVNKAIGRFIVSKLWLR
jgi:hypothetical protein